MKHTTVRYRLKADRVAEHEALLQEVFDALATERPAGLSYTVFKLADGLTFQHIASISVDGTPLTAVAAFKRFSAEIASRCDDPPAAAVSTLMGAYAPP